MDRCPRLPWAALTPLLFCGCVPAERDSVPVFSSFQRLCPSHRELLACPGHGHWPCPMRRSNPGRVGTLISKGKHTFHSVEEQSEPPSPPHPLPQHCRSPIVPCPLPHRASLSPSIKSSWAARDTQGPCTQPPTDTPHRGGGRLPPLHCPALPRLSSKHSNFL